MLRTAELATAGRVAPRVLRGLSWRAIATTLGLAALPTAITVMRGGTDLTLALATSAIVGSAVLGLAVDDDAAATIEAAPTRLAVRRAVRSTVTLALIVGAWAATAVVAASAGPLADLPWQRLGVVALLSGGTSLAAASMAQRHALAEQPGVAGLVAGALFPLLLTVTSQRLPWIPSVADESDTVPLLLIAAAAWLVAAWETRDPARS